MSNWSFYVVIAIGVIGIFGPMLIDIRHHALIQLFSLVIFLFGIFMSGVAYSNSTWENKIKEIELKNLRIENESNEQTDKLEVKVLEKTQFIKVRGDDIIKYIDREIVKYDETCKIPSELIEAINIAASEPSK